MVKAIRVSGRRSPSVLLLGLGISIVLLLSCLLFSVSLGAAEIDPGTIYRALTDFDGSTNHLIIRTARLPRTLIALLVGAALAVAGAIMQGLTRNPLADPGILGVESGAALAVVAATFVFGIDSLSVYAWFAFGGAAIVAVLVYLVAAWSPGGVNPLNLTITGAVFSALINTMISGILIVNQRTLEETRFWLAGSVTGRDIELLLQALPYLAIGLLLALALGKQITTLSLGEDIAQGLGQPTSWVKGLGAVSVVLLAGGSVAIAGPIGFIGLVVPHVARLLVGADYRWILPYSAVFGAVLLIASDIVARLVLRPQELPVGLIMPLIGAPLFLHLVRSRIKS